MHQIYYPVKQRLKIKDFFSPMIATRVSVSDFLQNRVKADTPEVILDFAGISFISRSATDEFVTFFEQNKITPRFVNQAENIDQMFRVVRKTHGQKQKRAFHEVPVVSFKSTSELNDFLAVL